MYKFILAPFLLIALAGCGGGDDKDTGSDASAGENESAGDSPGSCFYQCNLSGGATQYGCTTAEDLADEDACYEAGRGVCGANIGNTALLASCDGCNATCAPDWYQE